MLIINLMQSEKNLPTFFGNRGRNFMFGFVGVIRRDTQKILLENHKLTECDGGGSRLQTNGRVLHGLYSNICKKKTTLLHSLRLEADLTWTKIMDLIRAAGYNRPAGSGR